MWKGGRKLSRRRRDIKSKEIRDRGRSAEEEAGPPSSSVVCPDFIVMLDDQFNHDTACRSSPRSSKHLFHRSLSLSSVSFSMLACSFTSLFNSSTLDVTVDSLSGLVYTADTTGQVVLVMKSRKRSVKPETNFVANFPTARQITSLGDQITSLGVFSSIPLCMFKEKEGFITT